MGRDIDRESFEDADYDRFASDLREDLAALELLLRRPGFGAGPTTIGAELELALVDRAGRPLPINHAVLRQALDPRLQLEVDRFNLEFNATPLPLAGQSFRRLARELGAALAEVRAAAAPDGGRPVAIGILPTLRSADLGAGALSEQKRFRALSRAVRRLRGGPGRVAIEGEEALDVTCDDVTVEGANTSFQVHLRVEPARFARTFNAAQIAVAPVLAAATNSPIFLGRVLWEETRIPLFRQAVDERAADRRWQPARVSFGHGWVREGAHELFAEAAALHTPLLPVCGAERDPLACVRAGGVPALDELRLHQGTLWHWTRPLYDPGDGGHLRIELRALPSGPTVDDMVANAAFLLGLTLGLAPRAEQLLNALTFTHARDNFYAAARSGLDAQLLWPAERAPSPRPVRAGDLVPGLLPIAADALETAGVDAADRAHFLGLIAARVASGTTGARWQRRTLAALERDMPREQALATMLERYLECTGTGAPVHQWPVPP